MRDYHVYKDIWKASIGEQLLCQCETGNHADLFAVGGCQESSNCWSHITEDFFSLFLLTQKWHDKR